MSFFKSETPEIFQDYLETMGCYFEKPSFLAASRIDQCTTRPQTCDLPILLGRPGQILGSADGASSCARNYGSKPNHGRADLAQAQKMAKNALNAPCNLRGPDASPLSLQAAKTTLFLDQELLGETPKTG